MASLALQLLVRAHVWAIAQACGHTSTLVALTARGLSLCRQQLVYKAIWLELQDAVHAVDAMTVKTPQEAGLQ